jgi:aspartyl/asparaginyl-tRNA synthetase
MRLRRLICSLIFCLAFLNLACDAAYSITATKIKDILDHPRDYQSQDITVYGTVTNAVSLLVIKYYEIQDGTGSIKIVTDRLLPTRGEKLKATGRMTVVEVGTERWVVLRENQNPAGQFVGSTKADP